MKKLFLAFVLYGAATVAFAQSAENWQSYSGLIKSTVRKEYKGMFRKAGGLLSYPFLTPGSKQYNDVLWDWDSWLSNVALRQVLLEVGTAKDRADALQYEQGCVLNSLSFSGMDGWIPIFVDRDANPKTLKPDNIYEANMHKPCLAQHAAFLVQAEQGNAEWLRDKFYNLQTFVNNYRNHHRHHATGLYYWQTDFAIGVDNDPSTFYRPARSSGSIYLNCLMYKEFMAMVYLSKALHLPETATEYQRNADELQAAIRTHCWDEKDGFYYSVDLNLLPLRNEPMFDKHSGAPRDYDCLIQRLGSWSGFLALWSGVATPEQAKRIVAENYADARTFNAPYGVRSLSKLEKMYSLKASGNPSSWLGPVWGVSNYLTWRGLVKYGYETQARELASKTVLLFGQDLKKHGTLHEYYEPENGEPILNPGFQNWNYLVLNMLAWLEGQPVVAEF